jgi:hypothetical protein
MAKIIVSFKKHELDLYRHVMNQGDKSNYIKDALKSYIKNKNINTEKTLKAHDEIDDILNL